MNVGLLGDPSRAVTSCSVMPSAIDSASKVHIKSEAKRTHEARTGKDATPTRKAIANRMFRLLRIVPFLGFAFAKTGQKHASIAHTTAAAVASSLESRRKNPSDFAGPVAGLVTLAAMLWTILQRNRGRP